MASFSFHGEDGQDGTVLVDRRSSLLEIFVAAGRRYRMEAMNVVITSNDCFGRSEKNRLSETIVVLPRRFCLLLSCLEGGMMVELGGVWRW